MAAANLVRFSEDADTMTFPQCLAFIERSRRQLTRLRHLPGNEGPVDATEIASIMRDLDALEHRIRANPNCPK